VIGPQQHFLADIEQKLWHEGDIMRSKVPRHMSDPDSETSAKGREEGKMTAQMGSMAVSGANDAVVGRPGQSEELRARRAVMSGRK
jgi:hypothetical protein